MEINEAMVSNFREFNNGGFFTITINGTAYEVKYSNTGKQIETNAPKDIKDAIQAWWFV